MSIVTLGVASLGEVKARTAAAFAGRAQGAHLSFASAELLWRVLTAKRWEILRAMTGQGHLSTREVARRVARDVKAVHGDVRALVDAGLLEKDARGVTFPYEGVHVDFTLTKAA